MAVACFLIGLFLAIAGLLILVLLNDHAPFFFLMLIFGTSIAMGLIATVLPETHPIITVALAGFGLAIPSFAYQPLGPESRRVGTGCRPIRDCFLPVRGGGFPVQYVIDVPGITFRDALGFEDDFRLWPFIADICFYVCLVELTRRTVQYLRLSRARAG